ncbi:hypothetical protein [Actinoplanes sp. G11-F43]|uniref:hypothetical protein n=1 Tax=Actinoplanes sp. G11-F43 TaxID=3424130 RepID=UPI003D32EB24
MDESGPGTLLGFEIRRRHWTFEDARAAMARTARGMGVQGFTLSVRQLNRWLAGDVRRPRGIACQVAERLFGHRIEDLLGPAPARRGPERPSTGSCPLPPADAVPLSRRAAEHTRRHAHAAAAAVVDPVSIDALHQKVRTLARGYATTAPLALLTDLVDVRDDTYRLLGLTQRPGDLAELYLIAGQVCGLAATTSWDLGDPEAADAFADAAWTYAQLCGHTSLKAWVRGVQATVAVWAGRPAESLQHTEDGLRYAVGKPAVRLHAVAARAWTLLPGAAERATAALRLACAAREHDPGTDELADAVGGEFGFSRARLSLCAGAVYLGLGDGGQAAHYSHEALYLYAQTPPAQQRWAVEHGALIDLATARALQGDLEGAAEALHPALQLDPERRTARLTGRLQTLRRVVAVSTVRTLRRAHGLTEAIDDWTAGALVSAPLEAAAATGPAVRVPGPDPYRGLPAGPW